MRLQTRMESQTQYHKPVQYKDVIDEYFDGFVQLKPEQRPFKKEPEIEVQEYIKHQFHRYKLDVRLVKREFRVDYMQSYRKLDTVFFYPGQPLCEGSLIRHPTRYQQDNIAMIVECKNPSINIYNDKRNRSGWWYVKTSMEQCKSAEYGLLTNANDTRFCMKIDGVIEEVDEDTFWPPVQELLGDPVWKAKEEIGVPVMYEGITLKRN